MNNVKQQIERNINEIKQEWEELQVQLHLANMEAGNDWDKIEAQLSQLQLKSKEVGNAAGSAAQDIGTAAKLLGEEIAKGFAKIRRKL